MACYFRRDHVYSYVKKITRIKPPRQIYNGRAGQLCATYVYEVHLILIPIARTGIPNLPSHRKGLVGSEVGSILRTLRHQRARKNVANVCGCGCEC